MFTISTCPAIKQREYLALDIWNDWLTKGRCTDIMKKKRMMDMDFQTYLDTRGISKYRLSKLSGVPKTTVMDICSGKSSLQKCSAGTIWRLAKALQCTMEEIINEALKRIVPKTDMEKINKIVDETPFLSELQISFYKTMLKERKERILDFSYQKLLKQEC